MAPEAALEDPQLAELLALLDAIRIGNARECGLAGEELSRRLGAPDLHDGRESAAAVGPPRYRGSVIDEATIVEAGRRISTAAPEARVILFGSYARGRPDSRSDLDFLVIEPQVENAAIESVRLRRALRGLAVPADVVVVDENVARRRSAVAGTVVERALREGRVLVDA